MSLTLTINTSGGKMCVTLTQQKLNEIFGMGYISCLPPRTPEISGIVDGLIHLLPEELICIEQAVRGNILNCFIRHKTVTTVPRFTLTKLPEIDISKHEIVVVSDDGSKIERIYNLKLPS